MALKKLHALTDFYRKHGARVFVALILKKLSEFVNVDNRVQPLAKSEVREVEESVNRLVASRFPQTTALRVFLSSHAQHNSVYLVTDTLSPGSFLGGVGTAVIFAFQVAYKRDATLRIVTRNERCSPDMLDEFIRTMELPPLRGLSCEFHPINGDTSLEVGPHDLFITTSWWTTASSLKSVSSEKLVYLLQEDERIFYAQGDETVYVSDIFSNKKIRFVINTNLLRDHLINEGFKNLQTQATCFEPVFPQQLYNPQRPKDASRKKLFFYSRPQHPRNLFYLGLQVLDQCFSSGQLDPTLWEIIAVGRGTPQFRLSVSVPITILENMPWAEYTEVVGSCDLGLCLMLAPHPSYPPLELAAAGIPTVTSAYKLKQDLSGFSPNLFCVAPTIADLSEALCVASKRSRSPVSKDSLSTPHEAWTKAFRVSVDSVLS